MAAGASQPAFELLLQLQAAKESSPVSDAPDSTMPEQQEQTAAQKRDEAKRRRALLERYQNTYASALAPA